jgi:hypothetical protein
MAASHITAFLFSGKSNKEIFTKKYSFSMDIKKCTQTGSHFYSLACRETRGTTCYLLTKGCKKIGGGKEVYKKL